LQGRDVAIEDGVAEEIGLVVVELQGYNVTKNVIVK
jgi:hypothetical protein